MGSSEGDRDDGHRAAGQPGTGSRLRGGRRGLNFVALDRASRNDFVRRVLVKFGYAALGGRTRGW